MSEKYLSLGEEIIYLINGPQLCGDDTKKKINFCAGITDVLMFKKKGNWVVPPWLFWKFGLRSFWTTQLCGDDIKKKNELLCGENRWIVLDQKIEFTALALILSWVKVNNLMIYVKYSHFSHDLVASSWFFWKLVDLKSVV